MAKVYNDGYTQATSSESTDVLYMVRSPYGSGDDRWATLADIGIAPGSTYREETLAANTIVTATTVDTVNASTVRVGDWIAIDAYTVECEIRQVANVSGATLTTAALNFAHSAGDIVLRLEAPIWNVRLFAAAGDGVTDDFASIQATIDDAPDGARVYFPKGEYNWIPAPRGFTSVSGRDGLTIYGDGIGATTIILDKNLDYDWLSATPDAHLFICVASTNMTFRDFHYNGNADAILGLAGSINEQMHGVYFGALTVYSQAGGPCSGNTVTRCRFTNVRGDNVFTIGDSGNTVWVENIEISHNQFVDSHRSGHAHQRGSRDVRIHHNYYEGQSDQAIDTEATGSALPPERFLISDNIFIHTVTPNCIALGGIDSTLLMKEAIVTDNIIIGGNIRAGRLQDSVISGNLIIGGTLLKAVDIFRKNISLKITDNFVVSYNETQACIDLAGLGEASEDIELSNNTVISTEGQAGIKVEVCKQDLRVTDNKIYALGAGTTGSGISITALSQGEIIKNVKVDGNTIRNFENGITLTSGDSDTSPFSGVTVQNNTGQDLTNGVNLNNQTGSARPFVGLFISGNNWSSVTTPIFDQTVSKQLYWAIGGNQPGPTVYETAGIPAFAAAIGSIAANRNGAANTAVYIAEGATANDWRALETPTTALIRILRDLFSGSNGTLLTAHTPDEDIIGAGWTDNAGTWTLNGSDEVRQTAAGAAQASIDTGQANAVITSNMRLVGSGSYGGILIRYVDSNNYIRAELNTGVSALLRITKLIGGSTTVIDSVSMANFAGETIAISAQTKGDIITCTFAGVTLSVNESDLNTATKFGAWSNVASRYFFNDMRISI